MAVSGTAVAAIAAGGVCVYAGIKGVSIPQAVQAIVQGRSPASLTQANPITLPTGGGGADADFGGNPSRSSGSTPKPDLPHTGSKATPPTVGNTPSPLPRLPVVAPPRTQQTTPQTRLTAPAKSSGSTWWKPWTWW